MFLKRQLFVTRDAALLQQRLNQLDDAGIRYTVRTPSVFTAGRSHGVPGIDPSAAVDYRVYVAPKDYAESRRICGLS